LALANYNAIAPYTNAPEAPQEYWGMPAVDKSNVLSATAGFNLSPYSGFFNGQLNAYVGGGNVVLGSTTSPTWQLVGNGSTIQNNNSVSSYSSGGTNLVCQMLAYNTFFSPSPWVNTPYSITINTYASEQDGATECGNNWMPSSPPIATLVSRPWSQSDAWPAAPVVTTSSATSGGQLSANYCPSSGCTWGYAGTLPTGWSLSSSGLLSVVNGSPAATITVIAGNNFSFGNATLTVTPPGG
jgi:hypothetical protein